MATEQKEFSPLLPDGFHRMDRAELYDLCVSRFPHSANRGRLLGSLTAILDQAERLGIEATVWIDGSFLTHKINPNDLDAVFLVDTDFINRADELQREFLQGLVSRHTELRLAYGCDVYFQPIGSDAQSDDEDLRYWTKQFGLARDMATKKGIVVLSIATQ